MIIVIADVDEVAALLGLSTEPHPTIVRPQTSGPCVHYDERSEHVADVAPCTYPYEDGCPHLDNPEILCPVKGACAAMSEVARMRDACEVEQDEQDADMADVAPSQTYETAAPEGVEPEPEEPDFTVPHPTFRPGDRVRITHALHRGQTGKIERYFPATENYLVAIDGMPDRIILRDKDLEVEA